MGNLYEITFETYDFKGAVEGFIPIYGANENEVLVKFQSAMDALDYSSVQIKKITRHI